MDIKWQALGFTAVVFFSLALTQVERGGGIFFGTALSPKEGVFREGSDYRQAGLASLQAPQDVRSVPTRNWDILDPDLSAHSALLQSLDESFPFFHRETYVAWPAASLTKLLTSVIVLEDIGENKKITITERAVQTEGIAGNLRDGEIYSAGDLLKIMLLASSNDAAVAFEDYLGGADEFIRRMNLKARELQMTNSVFYDASGLSDLNTTTASDMLRLIKYILLNHSEIFQWTRIPSFLVQPVNDSESRLVYNINPLSGSEDFLGGKTGTSPRALENLVALFSFGKYRVVLVLLGSDDRAAEAKRLLEWVHTAYANL